MKLLYQILSKRLIDGAKKIIKGDEMVVCFYYVVYRYSFLILESDGSCLKDISGLFFRQLAPLYVVGVVGKFHMCLVIKTTLAFRSPLFYEKGTKV